ncbi:phosphatase PAP2 family protein [Lacibacter luteus]|uniref:Phosphatase PAP2 family protein n=1 Tax=Lacibacter luteus TaxID=2508719 RepID=A0A4Q1CML3_9BACT|nr:vanadium-dependent haloperoxidase [Lacibacter luteus]RXK62034.1 phosphatase PAP2 family protein [Lacibacter luteus]
MKKCVFSLLLLIFAGSFAKGGTDWRSTTERPVYLHRAMKQVTDVMVHDIYSPPVASRIYAYVAVAAYEAAHHADAGFVSFGGQLKGLSSLPKPTAGKEYSYALAAVHAMLLVAEAMVISEQKIKTEHAAMMEEIKNAGMPDEVYANSVAYGKIIAEKILLWASKDQYKETRALAKYPLSNDNRSWQPTPPAYMKAVEPNWNKLRTFVIDSAAQFKPARPTIFSTDKESRFYQEANDVYEIRLKLTNEQTEIANFWDCNPFKMNINGHVMFATKKISPGGHWINITALACKKAAAGLVQSAEAYVKVAIGLADSFISCWDEKYRSRVIRPETYINQHINKEWTPLLQTPPFPEYTSGHSVVSSASAVILTQLFGDHFSYDDSTELEFNIPVRHFNSFNEAAQEAAISRFYGGIHYMPSIINGLDEGKKIGFFIVNKLRTRRTAKPVAVRTSK